jgi:hypothetical protein
MSLIKQMTGHEDISSNASGGGASLDGYLYQVDISIWAALDLLLAKKLSQQVVLEPASKEDLEARLSDAEPGRLAARMNVSASQLLVVQAKLRNTGPWKIGELASLLQHGTDRLSAAERLKDSQVNYLLVTSADVDGVARTLRQGSFGESPKKLKLPPTIAKVVPRDAVGRIGILANADFERVQWKLRELLEGAFRVPHSRLEKCKSALREAALERMRGVGGGIWSREQIEQIIREHDGYLATSLEAETFVKPTNWSELKHALSDNNAVIITGSSGTGKTTAANVLLGELRVEVPGITPVHILHGPEEVRAAYRAGPVVFVIEDPWGKHRLEPRSAPWNDEIEKLLATANGNRRFIITSRSDVLAESHTRKLPTKWNVTLEAENYGPNERTKLFENRLPALPRPLQPAAAQYRAEALHRLRSPLEMQKYFDNLAEGQNGDENERQYVERCLTEAHRDAIEQTIVQQVDGKQAWPWAAVIWGLLKTQPKQSRALLADIQAGVGKRDVNLEDGLDHFVNFMVNGRNLRQVESVISYYHPRVEAALEAGMSRKPGLSSRVFGYLLDILVELNAGHDDDWGLEATANLVRALRHQDAVPFKISAGTQAALDAWIRKRLAAPGDEFRNDLSLAADAGSSSSTATQIAKWLLTMSRDHYSFGDHWSPDPDTEEWYKAMARDPLTEVICYGFVRFALPFQNDGYPDDFADHIGRLASDLTPSFLEVASMTLSRGYDPNAEAIAYGAVKDLAGFEDVLAEAVAFNEKLRAEDHSAKWLAVSNGEYDEEYAEHLGETAGEDGYTADVFIKAYVGALYKSRGWTALRDHPLLDDILYAWIDRVRRDPESCQEAELLALADKSIGHRHEDRFWSAAGGAWRDGLTSRLLERMICGHNSRGVRYSSTYCFARHAASFRDQLIQKLLASDTRRLVEIFLDLSGAWHDEDERPLIEPFVKATLSQLPKGIEEVASFLLEDPKAAPLLEGAALEFVPTLDPLGNSGLALEKAKLLEAVGQPASDLIVKLVKSPKSDESEDIGYASDALQLAVAQGALADYRGRACSPLRRCPQGCVRSPGREDSGPVAAQPPCARGGPEQRRAPRPCRHFEKPSCR